MTLFLFSSIPAAILLFYVLRKLELPNRLFKTGILFIFLGIISGVIVSILNYKFPVLNDLPKGSLNVFTYSIFNVGLVEELTKFSLFQLGMFFIISKDFKTRNMIIFYSMMTALGFALIENYSYAYTYGSKLLIGRSLISMPLHMCCGFIIGWFASSNTKWCTLIGLSVATLLHGIYDFFAFENYRIFAIITFGIALQYIFAGINTLKENGK